MGFDWGSGASGAASGAMAGSSFGPIGTGIGAIAGGLFGGFGGGGKPGKPKKISAFDKRQKSLYKDYMRSLYGKGRLGNIFDAGEFDADAANRNFDSMFARPAYQTFEQKVIPAITGQYRGQNLMNSTYSGEALANAGRDVQQNLDALRSDMVYRGSQAAIDRKMQMNMAKLGMMENALNRSTFAYEKPDGTGNSVDQILNSLGPAASQWLANQF